MEIYLDHLLVHGVEGDALCSTYTGCRALHSLSLRFGVVVFVVVIRIAVCHICKVVPHGIRGSVPVSVAKGVIGRDDVIALKWNIVLPTRFTLLKDERETQRQICAMGIGDALETSLLGGTDDILVDPFVMLYLIQVPDDGCYLV